MYECANVWSICSGDLPLSVVNSDRSVRKRSADTLAITSSLCQSVGRPGTDVYSLGAGPTVEVQTKRKKSERRAHLLNDWEKRWSHELRLPSLNDGYAQSAPWCCPPDGWFQSGLYHSVDVCGGWGMGSPLPPSAGCSASETEAPCVSAPLSPLFIPPSFQLFSSHFLSFCLLFSSLCPFFSVAFFLLLFYIRASRGLCVLSWIPSPEM